MNLYREASGALQRWRREHKQATLMEIEETVDEQLARMRAQMIQDLAMVSDLLLVHMDDTAVEDRPSVGRVESCALWQGGNARSPHDWLSTSH